ncbi:MAG: hypothetical protein ABIO46_03565 [Chitinophagales bacterium]
MQVFHNIFYSFPFQLALLHLRKFLFMLVPWVLLMLMVSGNLLSRLGFHYLFLDPEYFGKVNFTSFFLIGIGLGGFIFVWNITSYILNSFRFPFLATFERPFLRYTINNSFFPLVFIAVYFYSIIRFQYYSELKSFFEVITYQAALISGVSMMMIISMLRSLNIHIERFVQRRTRKNKRSKKIIRVNTLKNKAAIPFSPEIRVDYLLIHPFRVRPVRSVTHYQPEDLMRVFRLHHKNALIIELIALVIIIMLGFLKEIPFFQIPAGASILLLLSILLAPIGALSYWLRSWAVTAFIGLLIVANLLVKFDFINHRNKAFGMDYSHPATYNLAAIEGAVTPEIIEQDHATGLQMLENWKLKVAPFYHPLQKPPLIIVNASGGGLKASLWAFRLMQIADSATDNRFFDHCVFISGASGGIMGMSYYRELYRSKKLGDPIDLQDKHYINNISKDILNAVSFTYVVNDVLFPWQRFKANGFTYRKDRGYIFEKRFNQNTGFVMDRSLADYAPFEKSATIPILLFSPTVIDDGRRLLLSSTPLSYLTEPPQRRTSSNEMKVDGIDIHSFFKQQNGANLPFLTALRMNSTFPYIMPNVYLPTVPSVQAMDAGLRDNYGFETTYRFLYEFRDWINKNTSRVIIVQARGDYEKDYEPIVNEHPSLVQKLLDPISSLYAIWSDFHDYHQDELTGLADSWLDVDLNMISFEYVPEKKDQVASMSFHLTTREKQSILTTMENAENRAKLNKLVVLLSH